VIFLLIAGVRLFAFILFTCPEISGNFVDLGFVRKLFVLHVLLERTFQVSRDPLQKVKQRAEPPEQIGRK